MTFASPLPHSLEVTELRCEGLTNPLGVEERFPRLAWRIESAERGVRQASYHLQVASSRDRLLAGEADLWDSGEAASGQSLGVAYSGPALLSAQVCFWRVQITDRQGQRSPWSDPAWWEMGLLREEDWTAQWIGRTGGQDPVLPAPLLRQKFEMPGKITSARVYICGLGYYELFLNGRKVEDRVLEPLVTQYDRHAGYSTLDVTSYLRPGSNVIGVTLGNGWYNCHTSDVWNFDKAAWRSQPKLLLQMEAVLGTGETRRLVSGPDWDIADSPIRFDGLRNGETYDAREEKNWLSPDCDTAGWQKAAVLPGPGGLLFSQQAPPCVVAETVEPVQRREAPGRVIFDFGQNISGWAALSGQAPAGTELTIRYGERIGENGQLDTAHLAQFVTEGDFQTDRYIFSGSGEETWEPRFTYHGFQYAQVTGPEAVLGSVSLRARFVHTDMPPLGHFECSDAVLNQLAGCTLRSYRGNFVGIPTDCPHREKNGWTGDALIATETGLFSFDAAPAYAHWLRTLADTQRPSGQLPGIVPTAGWGYNWGSGPAWDSVCVLLPWNIYLFRGDLRILEENYPVMRRYAHFLQMMLVGGLAHWGLGDWCSPNSAQTAPDALVTSAYAYEDFRVLAEIAGRLGHAEDAAAYAELAGTMRDAWRREYLRGDGHCAGDEQTSLACALYFGFAALEEQAAVTRRLLEAVAGAGGKPTFGIHGAKWVLRALSNAGETDAAYRLLVQPDYPGWVHWLSQGATTLWEDWHGESSRNHIMFGDILAWMFASIAGIQPVPASPGFARVTIKPFPVAGLEWAAVQHCGPYGLIRSRWQRKEDGGLQVQITVPPNTEARVYLPTDNAKAVTESGIPLSRHESVFLQPAEPDALSTPKHEVVVHCGSGVYDFHLAS